MTANRKRKKSRKPRGDKILERLPPETKGTITRLLVIQGDKKCSDMIKRHDTLELMAGGLICTLASALHAVDAWHCGVHGATYPDKLIAIALDNVDKEYPVSLATLLEKKC